MKPALAHRLVGLCVFSTLTIAAFSLQMAWWALCPPATQTHQGTPATLALALVAIAASVGSWKEKPWGYILTILLCARENIVAVQAFYSQPANFRLGDIFSVALAGVPAAVGMIAAIALFVVHYAKKEELQGKPSSPAP